MVLDAMAHAPRWTGESRRVESSASFPSGVDKVETLRRSATWVGLRRS